MKQFTLVALMLSFSIYLPAQIKINSPYQQKQEKDKTYIPDNNEETSPSSNEPNTDAEENLIKVVIQDLFKAMNQSDGNKIKSLFSPEGRLVSTDANGKINVLSVDQFAQMIAQAAKGSLDERINSMEVKIDANLATVWAEYDFYFNKVLQHCGVDAFQLFRSTTGWKIIQISDTRRNDCLEGGKTAAIHQILDEWHKAAATADARKYFDLISPDGYYLGTDETEHWDKASFYKFAKPFFDKGNAWKFIARDRNVYLSDDNQISWFDELLDTWMGTCRGSGVLKRQPNGSWKIVQYNLAILVPNDVVQDYLKLVEARR